MVLHHHQGGTLNIFTLLNRTQQPGEVGIERDKTLKVKPYEGNRVATKPREVLYKCSFLKNTFYCLHYYNCPNFTPLPPLHWVPPSLQQFPPLSSCSWVIHTNSLSSPFPILFLTSPCLFSTYHLCYLFSVPFPPLSPPTAPLITLHVISISVNLFLF